MTVAAEDDTRLVGFVHVVFDDDDRWGSLIGNLHITQDRRRTGIGTALLTVPAEAAAERATDKSTHLWVLEQNPAAQQLYRAFGGTCIENAMVSPRRRTGPTQRLPQQAPLHLARRLIARLHHRPLIPADGSADSGGGRNTGVSAGRLRTGRLKRICGRRRVDTGVRGLRRCGAVSAGDVRLEGSDGAELVEMLGFVRDWLGSADSEALAASLNRFVGSDGDDLAELRADLARPGSWSCSAAMTDNCSSAARTTDSDPAGGGGLPRW